MSHPQHAPYPDRNAPQPGLVPLRPLRVGEILGAAVTVLRRHFLWLAAVSLTVSILGAAVMWSVLSATGSTEAFVDGSWLTDMTAGRSTSIPGGILLATVLQLVVSMTGGVLTAGVATVCAGQEALGRPTTGREWRSRLRGRWPSLLGVSLVVGVGTALGMLLLVVPGLLLYLAWFVATPVAVLEKAGVGTALRRSALLTRGEWGRLLGLAAAVLGVTLVLTVFLGSLVGELTGGMSATGSLLTSEIVSAVIALFTTGWAGAASALAYIDLRIRKENLGPTLAAAARA